MKHRKVFSPLKNEKGIALVLVLLIIVIISVLSLSMVGIATTTLKHSSGERDFQSTYYIAEAGATLMLHELSSEIMEIHEDHSSAHSFFSTVETELLNLNNTIEYDVFSDNKGETPNAEVTVEIAEMVDEETKRYKLVSKGQIGNRTRIVETYLDLSWHETSSDGEYISILNDMAIFTNGNITLSNSNSNVTGSIGTNSQVDNSISMHRNSSVSEYIYIPGAKQSVVDESSHHNKVRDLGEKRNYHLPPFPDLPTFSESSGNFHNGVIDSDRSFNVLGGNNSNIHIEVGSGQRIIRVKELLLGNSNSSLTIEGDGELLLYVEDKIDIKGKFNEANKNVTIYYSGENSVDITSNNSLFYTSLFYAKNANLKINGGNVRGHIFTGGNSIDFQGNGETHSQLLLAPNANVKLSGNATFKGSLISEQLTYSGNADVIYGEILEDEIITHFPGEGSTDVSREQILNINSIRER
ncbi:MULTISPECIES: PilX N-terminal domain-containing pilus assembly protein [Bacillaceae]|uniref:Type 4 fimbrial biogenesis protein PilX N-terminal domain-containing protein n=1 Tax=Evansella alkalicola TaxID=745819 RepID=A0ABS6JVM6_9BACI|nr:MULTISPECIES: PilX N-terminal domain-containing pilus assembly protein [Bacillaceae]MBU9722651.1 hypothetical protein [Bacillus alkalicola]